MNGLFRWSFRKHSCATASGLIIFGLRPLISSLGGVWSKNPGVTALLQHMPLHPHYMVLIHPKVLLQD